MRIPAIAAAIGLALCAGAGAQDEVRKAPSAATPDPATYVPEVARDAAAEGNAAFEKGDYDAARDAYRRVLKLAPESLVGLVNLGVVEFRSGHVAEAEELLKQAVRIRLENGPAWLTLGILYFEQNRLDAASAALAQAVFYDPASPRAHNYFGVVLGARGWLDGAESELRRAVAIDPAYRDAHYNLAVLYMRRTPPSVELARRHYHRSVELGAPADPELEKNLKPAPDPR